MPSTSNADTNLVTHSKPVIDGLCSRIDHDGCRLAVGISVARALVNDQGPRSDRRRNRVGVVWKIRRMVDKSPQLAVGPPASTRLAVLQILALSAQSDVSIWSDSLHPGRHGHRHRDAAVKEAGCESTLAQAGTTSHADPARVDLGNGRVQRIECPMETPCPGRQDACQN